MYVDWFSIKDTVLEQPGGGDAQGNVQVRGMALSCPLWEHPPLSQHLHVFANLEAL